MSTHPRFNPIKPNGPRRVLAALFAVIGLVALTGCTGEATVPEQAQPQWHVGCDGLDGAQAGDDFTEVALPCLVDETSFEVGPVDGKPTVISLWASWCGPCVTEAPEVQRFHELVESQISVFGVNTQDARERALFFAEDFDWTFPSLFDDRGEILRSQGLTALPAILFVDTDGATVATLTASDLTTDDLLAAAEEHFGVSV